MNTAINETNTTALHGKGKRAWKCCIRKRIVKCALQTLAVESDTRITIVGVHVYNNNNNDDG